MAKIGLNLGERVEIAGKAYRVLNAAIDVHAMLGNLKYGRIEGSEIVYEDAVQNGQTVSVNTGEIRGVTISVTSDVQEQTVFVLITDMFEAEIEELGLKYREEIELEDLQVSISSIDGRDVFNIFASRIKKKGVNQSSKQQGKQEQHKDQHHG